MYMHLKTKTIILFAAMLALLIFQFQTVSSEGEETGFVDLGKLLGLGEGKLFGQGMNITNGVLSFFNEKSQLIINKGESNQIILNDSKGVQISKSLEEITFVGEEGKININGNKFENIVPKGKDNNAFIKLDFLTGEISKAEFLTSAIGKYNINGASFVTKGNSRVSYNNLERGRLFLQNSKIESIEKPISIKGENVEVSSGYNLIKGYLNFDGKGNSFIKGGDSANINGIESILPAENKKYLFVGFDKDISSTEDSLTFTKDKLKLSSNKDLDHFIINFKEKNPYLKIESGDAVSIIPLDNSKIEINSRQGTGLIPQISILDGTLGITEDGKSINVFNRGLYLENSFSDGSTTSPIEVLFKKEIPGADGKLIVDNFNRMAMIPKYEEEYFVDYEGLNVKFSSKLKYNYLNEKNIETLIGKPVTLSSESTKGSQQMVLGRLRDYWATLTPEMQDAIKEIEISDKKILEAERFANSKYGIAALASKEQGKIVFRERDDAFDLDTFRHEAAHLREYEIDKEYKESLLHLDEYLALKANEKKAMEEIIKDNELHSLSDLERIHLIIESGDLEDEINSIEKNVNTFKKEWESISGEYNKATVTKDGELQYANTIDNKDITSPAGGYINAYGAMSFAEDVATFSGKILDTEFFKPLLSESNEYKEAYFKKLNLLYRHGFMSEEEYKAILNAAK